MDRRPCGSQGLELTAQGLGCMSLTKGAVLLLSRPSGAQCAAGFADAWRYA